MSDFLMQREVRRLQSTAKRQSSRKLNMASASFGSQPGSPLHGALPASSMGSAGIVTAASSSGGTSSSAADTAGSRRGRGGGSAGLSTGLVAAARSSNVSVGAIGGSDA